MELLLRDVVIQHDQIRRVCRDGVVWSMDLLYEKNWEKNQRIPKSGHYKEVEQRLVSSDWSVSNVDWWQTASRRGKDCNGGLQGEHFYFGANWVGVPPLPSSLSDSSQLSLPTALDVRKEGRILWVLNRCEEVVSLVGEDLDVRRNTHPF